MFSTSKEEIKINIVIFEFDYHSEVLLNSLKIFKSLPVRVFLFTTSKIWNGIRQSIKSDDLEVYHTHGNAKIKRMILNQVDLINNSHLIIFNTLASKFKFFTKLKLLPPVILRIHNANTYLHPNRNIDPKLSLFYIWKDLSYLVIHGLFKLELHYRPQFIKSQVNYFLFPTEAIQNYVLNNKYIAPEKTLLPIPYVFMKSDKSYNTIENCKDVNVAIIGGIDKRRRNYEVVLEAFKLLLPLMKTKTILHLLGKPYGFYGGKIIRNFKKLENEIFKVNTYKKFVKQVEFDKITQKADFFIIPTVQETRYKLYKELYGYTKISGSVNDMIIYKKPALIPEFYPVEKSLKPHVDFYSDEKKLKNQLYQWIEKKKFEKYKFSEPIDDYFFDNVVHKTGNCLLDAMNRYEIKSGN